jgi:hypothetical protein
MDNACNIPTETAMTLNLILNVPWLRQLVAGLSPQRTGSFHMGFVVDKLALGQVFL